MKTLTKIACAGALSLSASMANAQQSLRDVTYVTEGLIAVGIALEISDTCDSISGRTLRGIGYLNQLRNHARGLGFSSAEIKAFTDSKSEKNRLEAIARQRLANMGARPGNAASYCAVGRAEIAKASPIGTLLR